MNEDDRAVREMILAELSEPPEELLAMRLLLNGQPALTAHQRFLKGWMDRSPKEFMAAYQRANRDYRTEQRAKLVPEPSANPVPAAVVEEDESTERVRELYREVVERAT